MELLAPAGGVEEALAALAAGADALYCGLGNDFNARRGAHNFSDEDLAYVAREAHLRGARVYVTLNIVIKQSELQTVLDLIERAYHAGADAFIVQDFGLLYILNKLVPHLEIHMSTQANIHDVRGTLWCHDLGAKRVTLSRELTLKEIETIAASGVEIECFGHGAICICYSGVCMLSSLSGKRSANRGQCAQPCRLPYELVDDTHQSFVAIPEARLLCPKDMCTIDSVDQFYKAGVGSLKIEGRMKSAEYVYRVVRTYREALDEATGLEEKSASQACAWLISQDTPHNESAAISNRTSQLKRVFNRGFTDGYLWGRAHNAMMSYTRSNNQGELIGTVITSEQLKEKVERRGGAHGGRVRTRRFGQARIHIALTASVGKGDVLEVREDTKSDNFLTVSVAEDAPAGATIIAMAPRIMPKGASVRVIRSQAALDEVASLEHKLHQRKRTIALTATLRLNQPIELTATCDAVSVSVYGVQAEPARSRALTDETVQSHVSRTGNSPFVVTHCTVAMDEGLAVPFSALHALSAEACTKLAEALLRPYTDRADDEIVTNDALVDYLKQDHNATHGILGAPMSREDKARVFREQLSIVVATPEQAAHARLRGCTRIYAAYEHADQEWDDTCIPWLSEICREGDKAALDAHIHAHALVAVGSVSSLAYAREQGAVVELRHTVPVHNVAACQFFAEQGVSKLWLSPELTLEEIAELGSASEMELGVSVFGRERTMTCEHCILQAIGPCGHHCAQCERRQKQLYLKTIDDTYLPVYTGLSGRSTLWAPHKHDLTEYLDELWNAGVRHLLIDAQTFSLAEIDEALEQVEHALEALEGKRATHRALKGTTTAHLFAPIG